LLTPNDQANMHQVIYSNKLQVVRLGFQTSTLLVSKTSLDKLLKEKNSLSLIFQ